MLSLIAVWLVFGLALTVATGCEPESGPPGTKTDDGKDLRGIILNDDVSKAAIRIYSNWKGGDDPGDAKPTRLGAGQQGRLTKDWDGFCLPKGRSGSVRLVWGVLNYTNELAKGQCKKISDGQTAIVTVR